MKETNFKKAVDLYSVPPKWVQILVQLGADILAERLTLVINCCLLQGIFPDNAKIAVVVPLDKPVSTLNAFSKINEKVIKNELVSYLDNYLSQFMSAYRKSYSTVQVLIRLLEEWSEIRQEFR